MYTELLFCRKCDAYTTHNGVRSGSTMECERCATGEGKRYKFVEIEETEDVTEDK